MEWVLDMAKVLFSKEEKIAMQSPVQYRTARYQNDGLYSPGRVKKQLEKPSYDMEGDIIVGGMSDKRDLSLFYSRDIQVNPIRDRSLNAKRIQDAEAKLAEIYGSTPAYEGDLDLD